MEALRSLRSLSNSAGDSRTSSCVLPTAPYWWKWLTRDSLLSCRLPSGYVRCLCIRQRVGCLWFILLKPKRGDKWYKNHRHQCIIRIGSGPALFYWMGVTNIGKFRLNFEFSRLQVIEGFIAHFCTSHMGSTLCWLSIGYILETVRFFPHGENWW